MTDGRENGIILLIVLWALAMMTLIVAAMSAYAQRGISLASAETERLRSDWAVVSGVEAAKGYIAGLRPEERLALDGRKLIVDVGQGRRVQLVIEEGAGFVDINRADARLLQGVFALAGLGEAESGPLIEALGNLRVKNADPAKARRSPAEAGQDRAEVPSAGLVSLAELKSLPGGDAASLKDVMPLLGLYSEDGKINPLSAPEVVLRAVPGMTAEEIASIRNAKASRNPRAAISAVVEKHADFLALNDARIFVIGTVVEGGPGIVEGAGWKTAIILDPESRPPRFRTLALSW
jgi:general secretion pathway protein K